MSGIEAFASLPGARDNSDAGRPSKTFILSNRNRQYMMAWA